MFEVVNGSKEVVRDISSVRRVSDGHRKNQGSDPTSNPLQLGQFRLPHYAFRK